MRVDLVESFPARAASLGLPTGALLAALVWNDHVRPDRTLIALEKTPKLARLPLSCSLRNPQRALAMRRAREQRLSLNAYLEALIAAQVARPRAPLVTLYAERK